MTDAPEPPPPYVGAHQSSSTEPAFEELRATMRRPESILIAQILMWIAAGLSIVGMVGGYASSIAFAFDIEGDLAHFGEDALFFTMMMTVTSGFGFGLWLWMACANGAGLSWARPTATVLFALNLVYSVWYIPSTLPGLEIAAVTATAALVLGAVVLYLLWAGKGASEYYATMRSLR